MTAPSGIARLRHSIDKEPNQADQMSLDDLILPSSVGSPSGLSASPLIDGVGRSGSAVTSAIPIRKQRQKQQQQQQQQQKPQQQLAQPSQNRNQDARIPFGSAPSQPPRPRVTNEFGYVQRHVRKTSTDERRVWIVF